MAAGSKVDEGDARQVDWVRVSCAECNNAVATTERLFNGVTRCALCDGCAAYWDEHGLDTRASDGS
jgi:hypothetical protein